eukprot:gene13353-16280_t
MFNRQHKSDLLEIERFSCALTEAKAKLAAISRSMAMIEFDRDGIVLDANENFCKTMGYRAEEIRGKHHRIFCEEAYTHTDAYAKLWRDLARGEPLSGTFMRLNKHGQEVWLEASYMPVIGADNQVQSVIKVASDISARIHREHENQSLIDAIGRSMAVIEFTPQGQILNANDNFLKTVKYSLSEIVGQHHSLFCHRGETDSPAYKAFWASLNRGEYHSHRFERKDKFGQTLFLEASYNPIFDANGRLYKVVKFASDITDQVTTLRTAADSAHATSVQNDACARKGSEVVQQTVQIIEEISRDLNEAAVSIDAVSKQSDIIGTIQGTDQAVSSMQQSNTRARSTLDIAKSAGTALEEIASAFTLINERNLVIASASEEQAAVAREVDRNLMNIRDLAQQTSAGANQTSAASQELSRLAVDLNTMVA